MEIEERHPGRVRCSLLTEETKRPCRVIWRDGQKLGVVFDPKIKRSKNNGVMEVDTLTRPHECVRFDICC